MRSVFAFLMTAVLLCALPSCGKKAAPATPAPVSETGPFAYGAPVAVLFAYGYNDAAFLAETKELIRERFSRGDEPVNDEDIMAPLVFPDDFSNERISLLYDKIEGKTLSAFVLLGAPERTHAVLARFRDAWAERGGAIPVVSLFAQDDVLGTEAESDVAVDFVPLPESPAADDAENADASRRIPPATVVQILTELHRRSVETVENPSPPVSPEKSTVEALFGPDYVVTPYHDAETGLIAANHFLVDFGAAR